MYISSVDAIEFVEVSYEYDALDDRRFVFGYAWVNTAKRTPDFLPKIVYRFLKLIHVVRVSRYQGYRNCIRCDFKCTYSDF